MSDNKRDDRPPLVITVDDGEHPPQQDDEAASARQQEVASRQRAERIRIARMGPPTAPACFSHIIDHLYPGDASEASNAALNLQDLRQVICDKAVCAKCHHGLHVGFKVDGDATTVLVECSNDTCENQTIKRGPWIEKTRKEMLDELNEQD